MHRSNRRIDLPRPATGGLRPSAGPAWNPAPRLGWYRNPVLHADYSDPDAIRVGSTYWMVASSFGCDPGLPVLRSSDLVHWELAGHALRGQEPRGHFSVPRHGAGVWAPSIRFFDGEYRVFWGDPDHGVRVVRAADPAGPWSRPEAVLDAIGVIDPCPFRDEDGAWWMVHAWAGSRVGVNSLLHLRRMDAEGLRIVDEGVPVFDGHDEHHTIEGPKMHKRAGWYWILAPAGGVAGGWQVAMRSRSIRGPYEARIVLAQGRTAINGPHQGAWIETPAGESWFLHFQDRGPHGRVVHLQPMRWVDGWPEIGSPPGEPVAEHPAPAVDDPGPPVHPPEGDAFDRGALGPQWQWQANAEPYWHALMPGRRGLRLFAIRRPADWPNRWMSPNLLLQKLAAPAFRAATRVALRPEAEGRTAGLVVFGCAYAHLSVRYEDGAFRLVQAECLDAEGGAPEAVAESIPLAPDAARGPSWNGVPSSPAVHLRVDIGEDAQCRFAWSLDGGDWRPIGHAFQARAGRWVGAKVGLFCDHDPEGPNGGYADFDWFRISPLADAHP